MINGGDATWSRNQKGDSNINTSKTSTFFFINTNYTTNTPNWFFRHGGFHHSKLSKQIGLYGIVFLGEEITSK